MTLVARWREHFRGVFGNFLVAELPQKKRCFNKQEWTYLFWTGVVTAWSHALWRVLSNKIFWVLGHRDCWADTQHIHTFERDSLFFESCLLSTVTVTPSDSDYVNRSASLQQSHLEFTRLRADDHDYDLHSYWCAPGSRFTESLETVATTVVTGISHFIVGIGSLTCDVYFAFDDLRCFL